MGIYAAAENLRYQNKGLPETSISSPLRWLIDWAGGTKTKSGVSVNPENAISLTTIFNAITLISENLGQVPFAPHIKEKIKGRINSRIYKEHPSYQLVARRPHDYVSSMMFRQFIFSQACRYDNGYAFIERNNTGRPVSMFPLHSQRVTPKMTEDKRLVYDIDGEMTVSHMDMFHIVGYTKEGLTGYSRMQIAKEQIGKAIATQEFGASFFGKGINVSGFIKSPKLLKNSDAVERLKTSFAAKYGGNNNQFGVGVLEDGADWLKNENNPEEAQLNEAMKADGLMAAQLLNIPLTMLKIIERGTYNNVEQLDIQFVKYTLMPWGRKVEDECWYKLLTEREKAEDNIHYKFNFNGLLRGDTDSFSQFVERMTKSGVYSPNRILELLDENGYDGGDVHVLNPGAVTIEQLQNEKNTVTQD